MTPTTSAVKQAARQAVSAHPDADTRTQVIAALRALGIEPHTETEYNRVKKHVVSARNPKPRDGAPHGGARPNSGRPVSLPADRYIGTVTAQPGTDDAQRAHKLLSGYGSWCEDAQTWEVHLTPPQARRMREQHGERLMLVLACARVPAQGQDVTWRAGASGVPVWRRGFPGGRQ